MKCVFNDFIKQNDTICMPLYRRVFPEFYEKTWNPNAVEKIK
jgi:pre-rRNA-processing protein TSR1